MIDVITRLALVIMYGVLAFCAFRVSRRNHMLAARKISVTAVGIIASLWTMLWLLFLLTIPIDWTSYTPVRFQAWMSRVIHIPQIALLSLQIFMIRRSEDAGIQ